MLSHPSHPVQAFRAQSTVRPHQARGTFEFSPHQEAKEGESGPWRRLPNSSLTSPTLLQPPPPQGHRHQRFIKAEAQQSVCFTSLNVLLPSEKFSGRRRELKGWGETGSGRKQGGKEKKRELPLNCGSAESTHVYLASASRRTRSQAQGQGCGIQSHRLCTAQLWGIHSQRQQRWFCRGSRLAPVQMVWEWGGPASASPLISHLTFSCPNGGLQYSPFSPPSVPRKTCTL